MPVEFDVLRQLFDIHTYIQLFLSVQKKKRQNHSSMLIYNKTLLKQTNIFLRKQTK